MDDHINELEEKLNNGEFNENERKILAYSYSNDRITVKTAANLINMSDTTTRKILHGLASKQALVWHGNSKRDPKQYYARIKD